jgi:RNA polymerase sigma-70 factor (ECF subfamily)
MNEETILLNMIRRISDKSEHSFDQLYDKTHKKVFQYLYRITNDRYLAEDVLIDTYLEVWEHAGSFRGDSKVLTWLIGIARNLAMNEFRKKGFHEFELEKNESNPPDQFNTCAQAEAIRILKDVINKLNPTHREVLDLLFLQGMSYEDIAMIINIPVNTVKTRVFYAKEKLRNILNSKGITKDVLI